MYTYRPQTTLTATEAPCFIHVTDELGLHILLIYLFDKLINYI